MSDPFGFSIISALGREVLKRLNLSALLILLAVTLLSGLVWLAWPHVFLTGAIVSFALSATSFALSSRTRVAITQPGSRIPHYPRARPTLKRVAWGCLALSLVAAAAAIREWSLVPSKRIIVVANFDGPEPQRYRVTESVINGLRRALKDYPDADVVALGRSISEAEGSARALAQGRRLGATAVLWGWYAAGDGKVFPLSYHFDVLPSDHVTDYAPDFGCDAAGRIQVCPMEGLRDYKIQQVLSSEVSGLALYLLGSLRYYAGEWNGAAKAMAEALSRGGTLTKNPSLRLTLANAYAKVRRFGDAIRELYAAFDLDPTWPAPLYNRGLVRFIQGDFAKAAGDFSAALALKGDHEGAQCMLALAYSELGDFDASIAAAGECIRIAPADARGFVNRCDMYRKHRAYREALSDCDRAVQLDDRFVAAHYQRGLVRESMGDRAGARSDYYAVLQGSPATQELRDAVKSRLRVLGSAD